MNIVRLCVIERCAMFKQFSTTMLQLFVVDLITVKLVLNAGSRIIAGSLINAGLLRPVF